MTEFQKYIQRYLDLLPSENWIEEMKNTANKTLEIYQNLSEDQSNYRYAEGKWTLKVLLEHLTDTEKIFSYRALCIARNDQTNLPGFDEEQYAQNGIANRLSVEELLENFQLNRLNSLAFFSKLGNEELGRIGWSNGNQMSVENLGKLIVGHHLHHLAIIEERYLPNL